MGSIKENLKVIKEAKDQREIVEAFRVNLDEIYGFIQDTAPADLSEFEGLDGITVTRSEELGKADTVFDGRAFYSELMLVILSNGTALIIEKLSGPSSAGNDGKVMVAKSAEDAIKAATQIKKDIATYNKISNKLGNGEYEGLE